MKMLKPVVLVLGIVGATLGLLVAFGPLGAGAGHTERIKLEVRLDATDVDPLASGKTKWEERLNSDDTLERRRTSTEVEDVSAEGSYEVRVTRDVGLPTETVISSGEMFVEVDALGFGDLDLDSRDGDTVVTMLDGDFIEVLNPGGDVILSGSIQPKG